MYDANVCTGLVESSYSKVRLGHYMMGDLLPGLKRVSCCPSDRPRKSNMGAQQVMGWHMHQSLPV
jgi:hypothetical protein